MTRNLSRVREVVFSTLVVCGWGAEQAFGEESAFKVVRFERNPIIHPDMAGLEEKNRRGGREGDSINGPSLIRVPDWIEKPLGRYYLYFSHHSGRYIRLAYADGLAGPWTVHKPGTTVHIENLRVGRGHVASPDVHVDHENRRLVMYFHTPYKARPEEAKTRKEAKQVQRRVGQITSVAVSKDGIKFEPLPVVLGRFYFRVFRRGGYHYAVAKRGNESAVLYRSKDPLGPFEEGPKIIPRCRHTAVLLEGDTLLIFFSRIGDEPERLLLSRMRLTDDWTKWTPSEPVPVLKPELDYEGADLPQKPSRMGGAKGPLHELRDPAIYQEGGKTYLLYSVAGERGIAIAELLRRRQNKEE